MRSTECRLCAHPTFEIFVFVCRAISALNWSFDCVELIYFAAHHIRCPKLLRTLYLEAKKATTKHHPSLLEAWLRHVLGSGNFAAQDRGCPYWVGPVSFHTGASHVLKRLRSANELSLFSAVHALVGFAHNRMDATSAIERLKGLPGMDTYGYHLLRSWGACVRFLEYNGADYLPVLRPLHEEYCCSKMTAHVKALYSIVGEAGWKQIRYIGSVPSHGVVSGRVLSCADRSLLCCDLQQFLQSLGLVPTQNEMKTITDSYASACTAKKFLTLAKVLAQTKELVAPQAETMSACRREARVLNELWPDARKYAHSSVIAQMFSNQLPRIV